MNGFLEHIILNISDPKKSFPFPQYTPDYYAVFFEDPDRIKLEVAFFTSQY